jgi:hypothetical protein
MSTEPTTTPDELDVDEAAYAADDAMFGPQDADPEPATPVEDWFRNGRAGL